MVANGGDSGCGCVRVYGLLCVCVYRHCWVYMHCCACVLVSHTLALLWRLGPWYRHTLSFPLFTCLVTSFFQWCTREAGQMIRVPWDTTWVESDTHTHTYMISSIHMTSTIQINKYCSLQYRNTGSNT